MPGIDWIPGVSQIKAVAQLVTLDFDGAAETTKNFLQECPGVSQVTSTVQLATGDAKGAWETQKKCLGTVNNVANGIPVVGHAKGIVHHMVGDHEGGNQAMNAATRSTVVIGSGAVAGITTGGIGAIPAGMAAGVAYDATATIVTGEEQGYIAAIKSAAENPSAGTFIDALAIPVGDGLAGYSGGQMAAKANLSYLENLREAKLDKMDAAANSAEAMKYSNEIKVITKKINTIKHGTPVFWDDAKTGTLAPEATSANSSIPVTGYIDDNDKREETIAPCIRLAATASQGASLGSVCQEDALDYDSYVETIIESKESRRDAQKKLENFDAQSSKGDVHDNYKDVKFTTINNISDLLRQFGDDPRRNGTLPKCVRELFKWAWLLLIMPKQFSFTLAALVNSPFVGLYHSFIRHISDWEEVLPSDFNRISGRLAPLIAMVRRLSAATNRSDAEELREQFLQALRRLNREEYNNFQAAMVDIQIPMHRFIQQNLTFDNYLGRSMNTAGQVRLYFKVQTKSGTKVMILCLSDDLFDPVGGDPRPIRLLITAYFETWTEFTSHGLLETKEEMLKKNKK